MTVYSPERIRSAALARWGDVDPIAKYWQFVDQSAGPDGCWPWTGGRDRQGYGRCEWAGLPSAKASRVALILSLGRPLAAGMFACHHCDNPPCCNPAHLFEGTNAENMRDSLNKGLAPIGERHHASVVTDVEAHEIFQLRRKETQRAIAARYGISESTVWYIQTGRRAVR